ncbi:hypothetical protein SAMN04488024_106101 [Pedobacter soli]|uniref:Uncharacterized protein n=2 Tax=Pedobacter soli TaxID=390242 RepID=A0A1G6VDH2_9SPHI|nr:hypothetical protein SAMN04488024_106101 [Pedobacter soli]
MGSIALATLSLSILLFQISCKKEVNAQNTGSYVLPAATTSTLGGVIVGSGLSISPNGTLTANASTAQLNKLVYSKITFDSGGTYKGAEIWTANYDGTAQTKINVALPSGIVFSENPSPKLSPNGTKVFFTAGPASTYNPTMTTIESLYSCNIDGSGAVKIIEGTTISRIGDHMAY